jgi:hypothetical protein
MPDDYNYRPRTTNGASDAQGNASGAFTASQAADLIAKFQATRRPKSFDGRCPYVGPIPYQEADARLYYGRENQLEDLLDRLEKSRFICITGPENSGKTSLVQAGLIFALRNGAILDSEKWLIHTFTPGEHPLTALANACAILSERAGLSTVITDSIRKRGLTGPNALHDLIEMLLGPDKARRAQIFVDQFEEVFTRAKDDERGAFINFLTEAVKQPNSRLILIIAIRSERLGECAMYPNLQALIDKYSLEVAPMEPKELARAIILPALEAGVKIDPQLVARVVNDVQGDPAMMPLMQSALRGLFNAMPHKKGREMTLTLADYLDYGPIRPSAPEPEPATVSVTAAQAGVSQPQRLTQSELTAAQQASYFAQLRSNLRRYRIVSFAALIAMLALGALTVYALVQSSQSYQRAEAAAAAEAVAQANATRAVREEQAANVARTTAEAASTVAVQQREIAIATRAVAEAASTRAIAEQQAVLAVKGTAEVLATRAIERQQDNVRMQATISAVATHSGAMVRDAREAKATADADRQTVRARELAALALTQLSVDPQLGLLLALEAEKTQHTVQAEDALRRALLAAYPEAGVFRHNGAVNAARISSDGKSILTAGRDGLARIWNVDMTNVDASRPITTFRGHIGSVNDAQFSPDGKMIVTAGNDRTVRVWNIDTGRVISVLVGHTGVVTSAQFLSNQIVASVGSDKARFWDLATEEEIPSTGLPAPPEPQPDLTLAIGAGPTVELRDTFGQLIATLFGHTSPITTARFSPDEKMIITASRDGTARLHLVRLDDLIALAQSRATRELSCEERVRFLSEALVCPTATAAP